VATSVRARNTQRSPSQRRPRAQNWWRPARSGVTFGVPAVPPRLGATPAVDGLWLPQGGWRPAGDEGDARGPAEVGRRPGPAHDGREIPGLGFGQVGCCADLGRGGGITQRLLVPGFRCLARFAC